MKADHNNGKKTRVILFEFPDEVQRVINDMGEEYLRASETCIISLNPKVEAFLQKKSISCVNTLAFFDNDSHRRLVEKIEPILSAVHERMAYRDPSGVSDTYKHYLVFYLKSYMSYFFMHLELLDRIAERHQVGEVVYFQRRNYIAAKAMIDDGERLLAPLIETFCRRRDIRFKAIELHDAGSGRKMRLLDRFILRFTEIYFRVYLAFLKRSLKISNRFKKQKPVIVIPTWGYKFDDVMNDVKQSFPLAKRVMIIEKLNGAKQRIIAMLITLAKIIPLPRRFCAADVLIPLDVLAPRFKKGRADMTEGALEDIRSILDEFNRELTLQGVGLKDALFEKIEQGLWPELNQLVHKIYVLKELLKEFKPKLILSPFSIGLYYAMGELSQIMDIESCIITHGSHVPPQNRHEEVENYWLGRGVVLNSYRRVALQTPWLKKYLDHYNDERPAIVTGPLVFAFIGNRSQNMARDKKTLGIPENKKVFLYATTQKTRHCIRFYITETLDEFIDSLRDIVKAVDESKNSFLVIRPHPVCDLTSEEFKALLPKSDNYVIASGGKFENVLSIADGLISYSSTCIEEALSNGIPVILYDKWRRYKHIPVEEQSFDSFNLKDSPVSYVTDRQQLQKYFRTFEQEAKDGLWEDGTLQVHCFDRKNNENFYAYVGSCVNGGN